MVQSKMLSRIKGRISFSIVLLFVVSLACAKPKDQPNVVFILADDLGWADLPVYGNTFNEAPHLTELAGQGMTFTNAYATCPVCSPTRASIQSGQYPARVGIIDFIPGHYRPFEEVIVPTNKTRYLPHEIETIGEVMNKAGYKTGYFGKWHLGFTEEYSPAHQGYDEAHFYKGGGFYNPEFIPAISPKPEGRLSEILTDLSVNFIEENKDGPFFLFLAHFDVHVQLEADKELIDKYLKKERKDQYPGNAVYAAMVEHLDNSVGTVLDKLSSLGLEDNTIVIFYSDNGGLVTRFDGIPLIGKNSIEAYKDSPLKYIATSNAPLRAEKGTVYEGGIREPLIIRWPSKIKAATISEATVSSVDFFPTLLELIGAEKPKDQVLDGISLLPALLEDAYDPERPIYWHYPVYHHASPAGAIRKGDWKLIEDQVSGDFSLYNLRADISESSDLSKLYPAKKDELIQLLKAWQKDVGAEFPVENPNFDIHKRTQWGRRPIH